MAVAYPRRGNTIASGSMSWLFGLLKGTVAVAGVAGGLYAAGSRLMDDAQTLSVELEAAMAREGRKQQM